MGINVIASLSSGKLAYGAPELAGHHEHGVIEQAARPQIVNQSREAIIQNLSKRRQTPVDVAMHIPAAERDLDKARALVRSEHLF